MGDGRRRRRAVCRQASGSAKDSRLVIFTVLSPKLHSARNTWRNIHSLMRDESASDNSDKTCKSRRCIREESGEKGRESKLPSRSRPIYAPSLPPPSFPNRLTCRVERESMSFRLLRLKLLPAISLGREVNSIVNWPINFSSNPTTTTTTTKTFYASASGRARIRCIKRQNTRLQDMRFREVQRRHV